MISFMRFVLDEESNERCLFFNWPVRRTCPTNSTRNLVNIRTVGITFKSVVHWNIRFQRFHVDSSLPIGVKLSTEIQSQSEQIYLPHPHPHFPHTLSNRRMVCERYETSFRNWHISLPYRRESISGKRAVNHLMIASIRIPKTPIISAFIRVTNLSQPLMKLKRNGFNDRTILASVKEKLDIIFSFEDKLLRMCRQRKG